MPRGISWSSGVGRPKIAKPFGVILTVSRCRSVSKKARPRNFMARRPRAKPATPRPSGASSNRLMSGKRAVSPCDSGGKTGRPRMVLLRTGSWAAEEGRGSPCRLDGTIRNMPPRNLRPHAHRPSERGGRLRPEKGLGYGNTARALATGALMTGAPAPFVEARLGPTHSQRCIFVHRERRPGPP